MAWNVIEKYFDSGRTTFDIVEGDEAPSCKEDAGRNYDMYVELFDTREAAEAYVAEAKQNV